MPVFETNVTIDAPIERCFECCKSLELLTAFANRTQTATAIKVHPTQGQASFLRGVEYSFIPENSSKKVRLSVSLLEENPPTHLVLGGKLSLRSKYTLIYSLTSLGLQTKVAMRMEIEFVNAFFGKIIGLFGGFIQRSVLDVWKQFLKDAAENTQGEKEFNLFTSEDSAVIGEAEVVQQFSSRADIEGDFVTKPPTSSEGMSAGFLVVVIIGGFFAFWFFK